MNKSPRQLRLASLLVLTAALSGCAIYDTVPADAPTYEAYGYPDSYRGPGYYGPGYYQPGYYGGYWYGGGYYAPSYGGSYAPYPYYPGTHVIITGRGRDRDDGDRDRHHGDWNRDHRGDRDDRDRDHDGRDDRDQRDGPGPYRPPNAPIPGDPRGFNRRPNDPEPPPQAIRPMAPYTPQGPRENRPPPRDERPSPRDDRPQAPVVRVPPRGPGMGPALPPPSGDPPVGPSRQPPQQVYSPRTPAVPQPHPVDRRPQPPGPRDEDRNDRLRY